MTPLFRFQLVNHQLLAYEIELNSNGSRRFVQSKPPMNHIFKKDDAGSIMTIKTIHIILLLIMVMYSCFSVANVTSHNASQNDELKVMISELLDIAKTVNQTVYDKEGYPINTLQKIDKNPKAKGDYGKIERHIKKYLNSFIEIRNKYLTGEDWLKYEEFIVPNLLKSDSYISETKIVHVRIKQKTKNYTAKLNTLVDQFFNEFNALKIDRNIRNRLTKNSSEWIILIKNHSNQMKTHALNFMAIKETIFNFIIDNQEKWAIEDGQLLFYEQNDMEAMNSYMILLEKSTSEYENIQRSYRNEFNKMIWLWSQDIISKSND
ncbi:MAG: hypothetical protein RPU61_03895 [Candidatus Sedimenticola sp. (ex Thyasira tokunagai)]